MKKATKSNVWSKELMKAQAKGWMPLKLFKRSITKKDFGCYIRVGWMDGPAQDYIILSVKPDVQLLNINSLQTDYLDCKEQIFDIGGKCIISFQKK
jgi:hypothetical protein